MVEGVVISPSSLASYHFRTGGRRPQAVGTCEPLGNRPLAVKPLSYTGAELRLERSLPRTPRHVYGSDHAHVTDVPGQATVQMTGPPSGTGGNTVAGAFTPVLAKGRSHYR